jgi:ArsR family transcriptional regulator
MKTPLLGGFAALAQDTRLQVFRLLLQQGPDGLPASEVARRIGTLPNTRSTHLAILTRARLIQRQAGKPRSVLRRRPGGHPRPGCLSG